ncbi:MAG: hypothetical protein WA721_13875, partial [Candidatus Binataceae bacterium]
PTNGEIRRLRGAARVIENWDLRSRYPDAEPLPHWDSNIGGRVFDPPSITGETPAPRLNSGLRD